MMSRRSLCQGDPFLPALKTGSGCDYMMKDMSGCFDSRRIGSWRLGLY